MPAFPGGGVSAAVQQADGSLREAGGAATAPLLLVGLDEETTFVEFDVDCDSDIIPGYDLPVVRAHDHNFFNDSDEVCLCVASIECGCTSGRRFRRQEGTPPGDLGAALVGRQSSTVPSLCPGSASLSHVVA